MKYFSLIFFSLIILSATTAKGQQEDQQLKILYWNHYAAAKDGVAITLDEILKNPIISCSPDDFRVKSFVITAVKGDSILERTNEGGQLSDASIEGLKSLRPGCKLWIEKLTIETRDGRILSPLPTVRFDLK